MSKSALKTTDAEVQLTLVYLRSGVDEDPANTALMIESLAAQLATARAALVELVACKDLHGRSKDAVRGCEVGSHALVHEYDRRKPLAWAAARAAIAAAKGERE